MLLKLFHALRRFLFLWVRADIVNHVLPTDSTKTTYYVLSTPSLADHLVLEHACLNQHLPSSYSHNVLFLYQSYFWLFWKKKTPFQHDISSLLVKAQTESIQLIPVTILWGRSRGVEKSLIKALLSATWGNTGALQKTLTVFLHGRQTLIQFSQPISLNDVGLNNPERTAQKLTRILAVHFRNTRTAIIGPDRSHRRTLVNSLVFSPSVKNAIDAKGKNNPKQIAKLQAEARSYANEIASDYSYAVLRFMDIVLTWLWNKLYNGVAAYNIEKLQLIAAQKNIVYVPCHRSHIDYLLLSYVLNRNALMLPHIAAGINLNIPIVGGLLRRSGAFFMRRTFTNKIYTAVFDEYLHKVLQHGFALEYFVEGGRSRTGRLREPKTGMLAFTVRSLLRDPSQSIALMPVYINYEKIFEGATYLNELRGQSKKDESLLDVIVTLKQLKNNYGKVQVNFGEPIDLKEFVYSTTTEAINYSYQEDERIPWLNNTLDKLAFTVGQHINSAVAISPINLIALALLSSPQHSLDEKMLCQLLGHYHALLTKIPYSEEMILPDGTIQEWIHYAEQDMKIIQRQQHTLGDILSLQNEQAVLMTYCRNNILHLFALPSLLACLFNHHTSLSKKHITLVVQLLYPYLQHELFLRYDKNNIQDVVSQTLHTLVEMGLLEQHQSHYRLNKTNTTSSVILSLLSQAILPTLERFYIVFALLHARGTNTLKPSELEQQAQLIAQRLTVLHGLDAPEFSDKTLFSQFIYLLRENRLLTTNDEKKLEFDSVVENIMKNAKLVLSDDIRTSIESMLSPS